MRTYIILILFFFSGSIGAMTAEELRLLAGEAEQKQRQKDGRLDINDLNSFLPAVQKETITQPVSAPQADDVEPTAPQEPETVENPVKNEVTETTDPVKPKSSKYQEPSIIKALQPRPATQKQTSFSSDVYVPPPRPGSTSQNSGSSDAVELKQRRFGIPLGTWVSAKLNRQTTNSDPGLIELITTQDIVGQHKTLPIGTYLFSQKQFNSGTKRLDLHIILARLPDGQEIEINCLVYDSHKVAGLQGIIVENTSDAIEQGFKTGLVSAGQSLVNQGAQGSVAGSVLVSTAESLADTQNASINAQSKSLYTVHVSPQRVQVQVQTTF